MRQEELYLGLGEEDCVVGAESQWQEMEPVWWWAQSGWQQTSRPRGGLKSSRSRRAGAVSSGAQGIGAASGRPWDEVAPARRGTRGLRRPGGGDDDEARSGAAEDDEVGAARRAGAGRCRGLARAGAAGDARAAAGTTCRAGEVDDDAR